MQLRDKLNKLRTGEVKWQRKDNQIPL
jgi:hypothetical protein